MEISQVINIYPTLLTNTQAFGILIAKKQLWHVFLGVPKFIAF
jgi:hypothetical protein